MNGFFTISSGPFNVPLVNHVIVVKGDSWTDTCWCWELLRRELYAAFPILESTHAYTMASDFDCDTQDHLENILVFVQLDPECLKEICDRMGGQYLDRTDHFQEACAFTICDSCKWMQDEDKADDEFPCSNCIHNIPEGSQ